MRREVKKKHNFNFSMSESIWTLTVDGDTGTLDASLTNNNAAFCCKIS